MRIWGVLAVFVLTCGMALASGKVDFSRYETILSRKPFGEPPADPGAAAPATANPAASFVKDIRMCAITETPEFGIRVGFVDIVAKKNYFLSVGDAEDGIQLVDADYEKEAALLQKGGEAYWINMAGQVNAGSSGPDQFGAAAGPVAMATATVTVTPNPAPLRSSYTERVKKRRQAMEDRRKQQEEQMKQQPVLSAEEKDRLLKEYQMELIRAGGENGPALPLPLTQEMDDQLVAEGVLPPAEGSGTAPDESPVPPDGMVPPEQPAP